MGPIQLNDSPSRSSSSSTASREYRASVRGLPEALAESQQRTPGRPWLGIEEAGVDRTLDHMNRIV